jgi:type VI protein secretion system component Hcp
MTNDTDNSAVSENRELTDDELNAASGGVVVVPQDKTPQGASPLWYQPLTNNETLTSVVLSFSRP